MNKLNKVNNILFNVPIIDVTIFESNYLDGINKLLTIIRENWKLDDIKFKVFKDGYTNKLIACMRLCDEELMSDVILVRIYGDGSSLLINRDQEFITLSVLSYIGCSSLLYARFNNGIAYGFHQGVVLDNKLAILPDIQRLVITELVQLHSIDMNALINSNGQVSAFNKEPYLFSTIRKWLSLIPTNFFEKSNFNDLNDVTWKVELLELEINLLEKELLLMNSPVVFCHNDLLLKNIIYNKEKKKVSFIDFEYASYNYQAFDIANHFCEYAGMDAIDFNLYPSRDYQLNWLRLYLLEYNKINELQKEISDYNVECLYVQVNKFSLAAHVYWALWAIIQSIHSTIDYDYLYFAKMKLQEYNNRKKDYLSLFFPE